MASELTVGKLTATDDDITLAGGYGLDGSTASGSALHIRGKRQAVGGALVISTPGAAAGYADTTRMTFNGGAAQGSSSITINEPTTFANGIAVTTGGIKFPQPQSASADANTLDDYEEGELQPNVTCSTSGSYTTGGGRTYLAYTRIGRLVTVSGQIDITGESSPVGNLQVELPFTVGATSTEAGDTAFGTAVISDHGGTMVNNCTAIAHTATAFMKFFNVADDGTFSFIDKDDVDTVFQIHISLTFIAA